MSFSSNAQARTRLYLQSAKPGTVFGRQLNFYNGGATTPTSFTGNQILGTSTNGPGAWLINGAGPPIPVVECEAPVILIKSIVVGVDNIFINVDMSNISQSDAFILFNSGGAAFKALSVSPSGNEWLLVFPDQDVMPSGLYNLKVIRDGNLDCFSISYGLFDIAGFVCVVAARIWSLPGGVPFPPAVIPGPVLTEIQGSGFTTCTIDVSVARVFGPGPPTLPVSGLTVINDNLISFTVDGSAVLNAFYEATVFCTDFPGCEDPADNLIRFTVP